MNHYLSAAVRSSSTPLTIVLTNYADGSSVADDVRFLSQTYTYTPQNLFRLLSILSKPRNQFYYEYKGETNGLHHFETAHQNSYSAIDQFVVGDSGFHVKQVDAQNIRAVRCSGIEAIPTSGKLQSSVLPITHLEMLGDSIVFVFHGTWFRIENNGFVKLYPSELQCKTLSQAHYWQSQNSCVSSRHNTFAIVFGENDFGIVSNSITYNNISNFFYARNDGDRIIVLTSQNACIMKNGTADNLNIVLPTQFPLGNMTQSATIEQFLKAPILLQGNPSTTVQTSLIWGIQNTIANDIVLAEDKSTVCVPLGNRHAFVAFAIGENR